MQFPLLETNRLYLRKITINDANDIFEYLSNDTVTRYLGKNSLTNIEEVYEIINRLELNYNENRGIRWGIVLKDSNKLIGTMGYDALQIKNKRADIGYDINSHYWRKGFATETISEVIKFGFEQLDLNRIGVVVFPENIASSNLLKKFGFREEGLLREYIIQNNVPKDTIVFSLLRKEYSTK